MKRNIPMDNLVEVLDARLGAVATHPTPSPYRSLSHHPLGRITIYETYSSSGLGHYQTKRTGSKGDISQFQALTTALAATVGTGNIVGVATAIGIGGPGALFWMWVTGLLGMASKYAEAFLGVRFRGTDTAGEKS